MSSSNSFWHKNRFRTAAQWIQALTTLSILTILYLTRNFFGGELEAKVPTIPPLQNVEQNSYWNEDFWYGFRWEKSDKYQNKAFSWVDLVAVDPQEWVIFEDARVRVSFYLSGSIDEVEAKYPPTGPRAYSHLSRGIAVIEGDLESSTAKNVLATLHAR